MNEYTLRHPVKAVQFTGENSEEVENFIDSQLVNVKCSKGNGTHLIVEYTDVNNDYEDFYIKPGVGDYLIFSPFMEVIAFTQSRFNAQFKPIPKVGVEQDIEECRDDCLH